MDNEEIDRYKRLMLVHSYIYYTLNDSIIGDDTWQKWANHLVRINRPTGFYDEAFDGWDGTTGHHLPKDNWIMNKALYLLRIHDEKYNF